MEPLATRMRALVWLHRLQAMPGWCRPLLAWGLRRTRPAVARELDAMLASGHQVGTVVDTSPILIVAEAQAPDHALPGKDAIQRTGQHLGAWQVLDIIGQGGMGTVYRAERADGTYTREVALKCLHHELLSSRAIAAFHRERNALAGLNQRDIVPILDAGISDDGTPWFVMPIVKGEPIDAWCDRQRLDIRARVALLLEVCEAVKHAHQRGILHQDLKPSAILMDAEGHPKLLDFGLASVLRREDGLIGPDAGEGPVRGFSPGYSAPELLQGAPPSIEIDIYGLGALLHALLCGQAPVESIFRLPVPHEIAGERIQPPSVVATQGLATAADARSLSSRYALAKCLRGDLDMITLRCMQSDPARRYPDAQSLQDDLSAWLASRPISLRAHSRTYRIRRFLRRRRAALASAAVVAAIVIGVSGLAVFQHRESTRAMIISAKVEDIFSKSLGTAALSVTGSMPMTATELIDKAEREIRRQAAHEPEAILPRALAVLARSYSDAGRYDKAEALLHEANQANSGNRLESAINQAALARLQNLRAQHAKALQTSRNGLQRLRPRFGEQYDLIRIQFMTQQAIAQSGLGESALALDMLNAAIARASRLDSSAGRLALAQLLILRGNWYRMRIRLDASEADLLRAMTLAEGIEPLVVDDAREAMLRTIRASSKPDREAIALRMAHELLENRTRILGPDHPKTGVAQGELAFMQLLNQDFGNAATSFDKAMAIIEKSMGTRHPAYARQLVGTSFLSSMAGDHDAAIEKVERAVEIYTRHNGERHESTLDANFVMASHYSFAGDEGREKALALIERSIDAYMATHGEVLALHREAVASLLLKLGRIEKAREKFEIARRETIRQAGADSQEMLSIRFLETRLLLAEGADGAITLKKLDELIAAAGRVDTFYAKAMVFSAQFAKANYFINEGDMENARLALETARTLAVEQQQQGWESSVDQALKRLQE